MSLKEEYKSERNSFVMVQAFCHSFVIAICGYFLQSAIKQWEINSKYVDLSIQILKVAPSEEKMIIRKWAVEILDKYAEVKLDRRSQELLIYNGYFASEMANDLEMTDDLIMSDKKQFIHKSKK